MVELALPRELRTIGRRAIAEAQLRRAGTVEAEHVLLAILRVPSRIAAARLERAGLGYDIFQSALDDERRRSLAIAGIAPISTEALAAAGRTSMPGWGASIRDVLRTANKPSTKDGRPGGLEIELGLAILHADLGTVPRALAVAGIDRDALAAELNSSRPERGKLM
jgi:ATP-dependent Clp protease ATP-binding subunit ClpA